MFDILTTAALAVSFLYVLMLATNPRGAWNCPLSNLLSRIRRIFAKSF